MNGKRAFKFLKKIGFERMSGTEQELKVANMIAEEIESVGGKAEIESFEVNSQQIHEAKLEILEPIYKEYKVIGFGNAGSTPKEGLVGEFYYFSSDSLIDKENAKGKIVLVNGYLNRALYKKIMDAGAIGFITYNGDLKDKEVDIAYPELRDALKEIKVTPGVNMTVHDAVDLVLNEPTKIRLTLIQDEFKINSHNVIATIEGKTKKEEMIVLTAHYDSVRYSTGVYDNGAGSVINLETYRYFLNHTPERTLKFIWCGSEERGLLGSKAWVKDHEEELKKIRLCINCDVAGPVLGTNAIFVTASDEILKFCQAFGNEIDFPANYYLDTYSSDCIPFADKDIPAISITRFGSSGTAYIHNRHDIIKYLDYKNLEITGNYQIKLLERIISSNHIPFECKVDKEVKDKVDKYLFKKE